MSCLIAGSSPHVARSYAESFRASDGPQRTAEAGTGSGQSPSQAAHRPENPDLSHPAGRAPDGRKQATDPSGKPLAAEEQAEIEKLKARDREVRAHEQAHLAAGAGLITRGASYSYKRGPDGQQYVVGGEVGIDTSPVRGDPAAALRKAEQIRRAALAPAEPSPQDRAVAAEASRMAAEARRELAQKAYAEQPAARRSALQLSA